MGFLRRRSFPEAWLLLVVGLCILATVAADVLYFGGGRGRAETAAPANSHYPLPQLTGVLRLQHQDYLAGFPIGGPCKGLGAYDDLLGGTVVTIADETSATIATGSLDIGRIADASTCEFVVVVQTLPKAGRYQFEIDGRSVGSYGYGDLVANGWQVTLTLG
jgi:hypothetical protein